MPPAERAAAGHAHPSEHPDHAEHSEHAEHATTTAVERELRDRGYRLTPQRQLVLAAVEELGHATPEQVLQLVRERASSVNASTVYRTLELLEELGLVSHAHLGRGPGHGAPTYHPASAADHAHLVCRRCGRVIEATPADVAPLARQLADRFGFVVDLRHLAVFGECANCRAVPARPAARE